ncbi:hypothetical protein BN903_142 [Halorubrum sp. AJ67]|nr:hypothetical protein BN903_142 [Halorubrum sp. AJ67]
MDRSDTVLCWLFNSLSRSNGIADRRPKLVDRCGSDTRGHRTVVVPFCSVTDDSRSEMAVL